MNDIPRDNATNFQSGWIESTQKFHHQYKKQGIS